MATLNPFDLLDDDAEDPSQLAVSIASDKSKKSAPVSGLPAKSAPPSSKQPSPSQAGLRSTLLSITKHLYSSVWSFCIWYLIVSFYVLD